MRFVRFAALCAIALSALHCIASNPIEIPLTYIAIPDRVRETEDTTARGRGNGERDELLAYSGAAGYQHLQPSATPPSGEWKMPDLVSTQPLYHLAKFTDRERLIVFDCAARGDRFYNKAYFDANANGNLADDTPLTATLQEAIYGDNQRFFSAEFAPTDTTVTVGGTALPLRLVPSIIYSGPWTPDGKIADSRYVYGNIRSWCAYAGAFELKGAKYRVVLGDSNVNGDFTDREHARDTLFVLEPGQEMGWNSNMLLPDVLVVAGETLDITMDMAARRMILTPTTAPLATLRLSSPARLLQLASASALRSMVLAVNPASEIQVPESAYRIQQYLLEKTDAQGDLWRLRAHSSPNTNLVQASAARPTDLVFAEPFRSTIRARGAGPSDHSSPPAWWQFWKSAAPPTRRSKVYLDYAIHGAAGEPVVSLDHTSGTATKIVMSDKYSVRPKEPVCKIVTDDDEALAQVKFEYG